MSEQKVKTNGFSLVISGNILDGFERETVVAVLAKILNIDAQKSALLLGGRPRCIKKNISETQAQKYLTIVRSKGIEASIEPPLPSVANAATQPQLGASSTRSPTRSPTKSPTKSSQEPTPVVDTENTGSQRECTSSESLIAMDASFAPPRLSLGLCVYMVATASVVAVLVVLYVCVGVLLAGVSIERIYHLVMNASTLTSVSIVFFHLIPALVSLFVLLIFLRPAFPKRHYCVVPGERITEQGQPRLFSYLRALSEALGAPMPQSVVLTPELGVTLLREPEGHLFSRRVSTLYIGLSLFKILSEVQLSGVIARELWFDESRRAKLPAFFVKSIFSRLILIHKNQDGWTGWLAKRRKSGGLKFLWFTVDVLLNISQQFSKIFLFPVGVVSIPFLRKFHGVADDCHTDVAGSVERGATFLTLERARYACVNVIRKMLNAPGALRLVNDLSGLVEHDVDAQSVQTVKMLEDTMRMTEAKWLDDWAEVRERILRAEDRNAAPAITVNIGADALIECYSDVCVQVSQSYYASLQLFVNSNDLVDIAAYTESSEKELLREAKVQQYFNGWFRPELYWVVPPPEKVQTLAQATKIALLNDAVKRLRYATPEYLKILTDLPAIKEKLRTLNIAYEIKKAGYGIQKEYFDPNQFAQADFSHAYQTLKREHQVLLQRQHKFSEVMGLRLLLAVSVATDDDDLYLGRKLIDILRCINQQRELLNKLQMPVGFLPVALARMQEKKEIKHQPRIQRVLRDISKCCDDTLQALSHLGWPLSDEYKTAAEFVLAQVKPQENSAEENVLDRVEYYFQVLKSVDGANQIVNGQLAIIAGKSEAAFDIEKIKVALV